MECEHQCERTEYQACPAACASAGYVGVDGLGEEGVGAREGGQGHLSVSILTLSRSRLLPPVTPRLLSYYIVFLLRAIHRVISSLLYLRFVVLPVEMPATFNVRTASTRAALGLQLNRPRRLKVQPFGTYSFKRIQFGQ